MLYEVITDKCLKVGNDRLIQSRNVRMIAKGVFHRWKLVYLDLPALCADGHGKRKGLFVLNLFPVGKKVTARLGSEIDKSS